MSVTAIEATLDKSAALADTRASLPELIVVAAALKAHIADLLPAAETEADGLWRGGLEWCGLRARLDIARRHTSDDMPLSPLSAQVHVALLRRDCEWLLERYGTALTGVAS
ncbi:DUF6415 family natural product biosynthesis protein [Streptomyces sp. NPDC088124]|uniref:DUF6415 family natural product biosynthesis protein n=1 Tax=Streptomyces sp. NPDC088124 TaxID=3154654 RepID=UPI0034124FA4